jgi:hypothetical protein
VHPCASTDLAADWTPVWIAFGESWSQGHEPLPWAAHQVLWSTLEAFGDSARWRRRLGGIARLSVPRERTA